MALDASLRELACHFQIPGTLAGTVAARQSATAFGEKRKWSAQVRQELELILSECLANIVKHGQACAEAPIRIQILDNGAELRLEIRDQGIPFNPLDAAEPDLDLPLDERPIGGLGVFIVRSLAQEVRWSREGGENVLTILKSTHTPNMPPPRSRLSHGGPELRP